MNNDRTIKKIFKTKPDGTRRAGRPKIRWEDGVDQDMTTLGSRTGGGSPSTGKKGQNFLRRPGPTKGCRANDDDDDDFYARSSQFEHGTGCQNDVEDLQTRMRPTEP
jgi:hypothetical protein